MKSVALEPSSLLAPSTNEIDIAPHFVLDGFKRARARDPDLESERAFAGATRFTRGRSRHRTARAAFRSAIGHQHAAQSLPKPRVRRFSRRALAGGGGKP
jgi:hypothetical protein